VPLKNETLGCENSFLNDPRSQKPWTTQQIDKMSPSYFLIESVDRSWVFRVIRCFMLIEFPTLAYVIHQSRSQCVDICPPSKELQASLTILVGIAHNTYLLVPLLKVRLVDAELIRPKNNLFIFLPKWIERIVQIRRSSSFDIIADDRLSHNEISPNIRKAIGYRVFV